VEEYKASRQGRHSLRFAGTWDKLIPNNWIGTAEQIAEKISATKAKGITHFNALHIAGDSLQERKEQMHMFAETVIPLIK